MKKLVIVPLAALTLGFGFLGDIASASESHNTTPVKMKLASVDTLIDEQESTYDGHYNSSFYVSYGRDVRVYVKNNGDIPITVTLTNENGKQIFKQVIQGKGQKEFPEKYFTEGEYYYSIDGKGADTDFRFRAVGL
ncbi:hypothetical protein ACQKMD_12345 [Viridibacillus sp. NPDC096237]|uniref:hypothetical protein n=1 Tax=Viridibacillus sp. NPDC096237 TaxID=3390721 RepID=UPI003CFE3D19